MQELHSFSYPVYAVGVVARSAVAVAGGGGMVKTGIPNKIDVLHLREDKAMQPVKNRGALKAEISGSMDTGLEAVMNMSVCRAGDGSLIYSLEGEQCVEYLVHKTSSQVDTTQRLANSIDVNESVANVVRNRRTARGLNSSSQSPGNHNVTVEHASGNEWTLSRLRSFRAPKESSSPLTCVCTGGPGDDWLAVGADNGAVDLIDLSSERDDDEMQTDEMKPFRHYVDVSGGRSAGVYNLSLSYPNRGHPNQPPLLATVCYQPASDVVRLWRTSCHDIEDLDKPFASASAAYLSDPSAAAEQPAVKTVHATFKFKHCRFLHGTVSTESAHLLATSMEPLRATRNDTSRLVLWTVPLSSSTSDTINLLPLSQVRLPQGQQPACLAAHPNPERVLLAVGTLEGQIMVYCLTPHNLQLHCVYSTPRAHPAFVTAVTFLPPRSWSRDASVSNPDPDQSYELVSVSVDQSLRWHPGPSYLRIAHLLHGLRDPKRGLLDRLRSVCVALFWTWLILFLPLLLSLLSRVMDRLL